MKGVSVSNIRAFVSALLAEVDQLLVGEPARAIGYGSAVVIFLAIQVANAAGVTRFGANIPFEEAVGLAFAAIVTVTTVVESIRRFVYSPQTFIEQLADANADGFAAGHADAHDELEPVLRAQQSLLLEAQEAAAAPKTRRVAVGTMPTSGKQN
jgi:hypothetical protein